MKKIYSQISLLLILSFCFTNVHAQFSGAFAPANWGTVQVNSNGVTNTSGAPASVSMTSSDGLTGLGTNDFTITMPQSGVITFSWNYSTVDGANWDYPQYVINGVGTLVSGYSQAGTSTQNGTQPGICVTAGSIFGFRMVSADNFGGPASTVFSNFVFTPAALTITASSPTICPGSTISLTASGSTTYSWSGGITNGSAFTPTNGSVYTVSSNISGCVMTKTYAPIFFPAITVTTAANPICNGSSVLLTASGGTAYAWNTGPSTNTTSVSPSSLQSYTVSGTTADGCASSAAITISVNPGTPTLTVVSSTPSTCFGRSATLTASGALSYTWTNGVSNGVSFFPSTTTTYTVSGSNACGITNAVTTITVLPLPISLALTTTLYCTNSTQTITATSPGSTYTWNPGALVNTNPVLIVNPSVTTVYSVSASDGTCSGTTTVSVVANQAPTITAAASTTALCPGGSVVLTATGGNNYTWTPGPLSGASVTVSPVQTLVYNVVGDNNAGCSSGATQIVLVGTQPTLALSTSNSTICGGSSATLTATGAHTYLWSNGPTTTVNVVNPSQSTVYTVVGTNTVYMCTDTQTINVEVYNPVLSISGSTAVCVGGSGTITASGATSYTWEPGPLLSANISIAPVVNTVYTVSALSFSNNVNCPVSATFEVIANALPVISVVGTKTAVCPKETNTLTANGATNYTWTSANGSTLAANSLTLSSPVAAALLYTLSGRDAKGCESTTVIASSISPCTGIEQIGTDAKQWSVYPNPNNGHFVVSSSEPLDVAILNELGQEIRQLSLRSENNYSVTIRDLTAGIYFMVSNRGNYKIIVER